MRGVALDPALRNIGIVEFDVIDGVPIPYNIDIIQTKKEKGLVGLDDLRRARILFNGLQKFTKDKDLILAELPTGSQSSRSAIGIGMVIGLLSMMDNLTTFSPDTVKKVVKKGATKEEMIEWGMTKYPTLYWPKAKGKREHICDALAVMNLLP